MGDRNDGELIDLVRGGDASALEALFERHYAGVYRLAYRWCGVREDAEDIAQEVFVKLVRRLATFRGGSSFTTWLHRIVVNTALDQRRRAAAAPVPCEDCDRDPAPPPPAADGEPGEAGRLQEALGLLPEKQRAALLLVFGEGMNHREAAAVLGCPEVSVSWRIFQARRKLRTLLERER